MHLLIVEDSEVHLKLIQKVLETDFEISTADSKQGALGLIKKNKFDAILTDYILEKSTGIELIREVKRLNPYLPVIFMTSRGSEKVAVEAMKLGASDYILKGEDDFSELPDRVRLSINKNLNELKQKNLQDEVVQQNEILKNLNQQRDDLISIVSHDLKNPLGFINTASRVLLQGKKDLNQESLDLINRIEQNSEIALNLIADLLDLGKLESDSVRLTYEQFEITDILTTICASLKFKAESKRITVKFDPKQKVEVRADYGRLIQLFTNIIDNAIKYSPENTEVSIDFETFEGRRSVDNKLPVLKVFIKDQGRGVPADKLQSIFNKYEQAQARDVSQGTGLGLAICKKICEAHRGNIWVESDGTGSGSTFVIVLPIVVSLSEEKTVEQVRVLLADDSEDIRMLVGEDLEELGYDVQVVDNGEDALKFLKSEDVDILFTDLSMPKMDGYALLSNIRQDEKLKDLPSIVMTNAALPSKMASLDRLATDFIYKPAGVDELKEKVQSYVRTDRDLSLDVDNNLVLVVDDEEDLRTMLKDVLELEGYICKEAKNGFEALFLASKYEFSAILSDINMPNMNGIKFIEALKEKKDKVPPVVFISGRLEEIPDKLKDEIGLTNFVSKPYKFEKIISTLGRLIHQNTKVETTVKPTILVVDDSKDIHLLVRRILQKTGFVVQSAFNEAKALDLCRNNDFSLVLLDLHLPDASGFEVAEKLKDIFEGRGVKVPKLVSFTSADEDAQDRFKQVGVGFRINKPIDIKTFEQEIQKILQA